MSLLAIQDRLAALLAAHPHFAGWEILTERVGNLEDRIQAALQQLGRGVVIHSANGVASGVQEDFCALSETIAIEVTLAPLVFPDTSALAGIDAAIAALAGQPVTAGSRGPARIEVVDHRAVPEAAQQGIDVHQLIIRASVEVPTTA